MNQVGQLKWRGPTTRLSALGSIVVVGAIELENLTEQIGRNVETGGLNCQDRLREIEEKPFGSHFENAQRADHADFLSGRSVACGLVVKEDQVGAQFDSQRDCLAFAGAELLKGWIDHLRFAHHEPLRWTRDESTNVFGRGVAREFFSDCGRNDDLAKQDRKDVDLPDETQIVDRRSVRDDNHWTLSLVSEQIGECLSVCLVVFD